MNRFKIQKKDFLSHDCFGYLYKNVDILPSQTNWRK